MCHGGFRRCTMPMLNTGRTPHALTFRKANHVTITRACQGDSGCHDDVLPGGMRMPGTARAGLERHIRRTIVGHVIFRITLASSGALAAD